MDFSIITTLASSTLIDNLLYFPWGRMALIGFVIYLFLCFYAWIFADRILFPVPKQPDYEKDETVFFIATNKGDQIACKHWIPENPKGLTILYSHGNAEDIGRIEDFLQTWVKDGYSVFAYDYPGYGHSPGKPSEEGCYAAIDTAFKHLTSKLEISASKIIVWGRSLGTGPSCYLAERESFGGLILETPFITAYRTVTETPVLPWDRFRNIHRAPNIQNKSLVIHGHEDEIVPFRHGKRVFNALPEPKQFLEFIHAGHNDLPEIGGEKYRDGINDFLTEVLDG
jgi:alpha-beta hydrolase superfamily lysophospholipase